MKKTLLILSFAIPFSSFAGQSVTLLSPGEQSSDGKYVCQGSNTASSAQPKMLCAVYDYCGYVKREDAPANQWTPAGCAAEFGHLTKGGAYSEALSLAAHLAPGCTIVEFSK